MILSDGERVIEIRVIEHRQKDATVAIKASEDVKIQRVR